jgi:Mrp family chromosome partitioning ATPase
MTTTIQSSDRKTRTRSAVPREALEIDNLLWRIHARIDASNNKGSMIGIIGGCRDSGVSTLVANLATRAADSHMAPVLIIDANFRSPKQHRFFRLKPKQGVSDVLAGSLAPVEAVLPTQVDGLDLMPMGPVNELELTRLFSENCIELMRWAKDNYSTVVVDFPPIDDIREGLMLARQLDMCLIAIKSESLSKKIAEQRVEQLISDGVNVAGTILTRKRFFTPKMFRS